MKKLDFSKFKQVGKNDKILLLTHTDMDGANIVIMNQMFNNVDVKNCSNSNMSYFIKKNVCDNNDYDTILVVDISCNEEDAAIINANPNKRKLILLDHHETALNLNKYSWAMVEQNIIEDSFRASYYKGIEGGHSSGTSLLYDFLDYQGHTERVKNKELLKEYVNNVAMYDTWDWNDLFDKKEEPKELEDTFEMYGIDMFQRLMSEKISKGERLVGIEEKKLLEEFKVKEQEYVDQVSKEFKEGVININGKDYTFLMGVCDSHLGPIFEKMKEFYDGYDLYFINYGSGLSLRTSRDDIHIGNLISKFGGGGHPGAGGIRIGKELQVAQIEKNLPEVSFYIDRNEKGYIETPKDVKFEEIKSLDKYKNLPVKEALRMESEDRKKMKTMFLIKKGIITGTMKDKNGEYSSFAMAFNSSHKEETRNAMKEMFPFVDKYFICSDTSFEYENIKTNKVKIVEFSEESVLETMSTVFKGASICLTSDNLLEI